MSFFTRNILSFYKHSRHNEWYFKKHFSDNLHPGFCFPNASDPYNFGSKGQEKSFSGTVDDNNTYKINSLGLRGEIYKDTEILASGCSITFGLGVPELGRWTNLLGNSIDKNVMNLGNSGASVKTICIDIIEYCMNNKMPKQIFCLMPDFFRSVVVVDREFYNTREKGKNIPVIEDLQITFCNPEINKTKDSIVMKIEDKKYTEDSVSPHQLILDSVNYIYILESFCLSNNIKLNWTTWDLPTATILQELQKSKEFKLKNFTPLWNPFEVMGFNSYVNLNCTSDHGSEFRKNKSWPIGSDYSLVRGKKKKDWAHPGIHFQYHVADFFYEIYRQSNPAT